MSNSSKAAKQLSAKRIRTRNNVIVYIVLSVLAFIWLFPVAWIVMTSFRGEKGSYISTFFPKSYTLDNYIKLFTDTSLLNFPQMFLNTLFVAICSCILSSFFLLSASYCLSRLRFKLRRPYMNMAMILGLFPGFMSMVAVYFILKAVGLTEGNSVRLALILCYSGGVALGFQIPHGPGRGRPAGRLHPVADLHQDHPAPVQAHRHLHHPNQLYGALGRLRLCKGHLPRQR